MHPAFSVIFLTTLIGLGQGLFLALYTEQVYSILKVLQTQVYIEYFSKASMVSLGLLVLGLIASFFHLGHPERAWRSATQWRTSWLSREVIVLPISMFFIFVYGCIYHFDLNATLFNVGEIPINISLIVGFIATLMTFSLYVSTRMIYASIRFLQEWHSPLTVINYTLIGVASGFTLAAAIASEFAPGLLNFYTGWSIALIIIAFIFRLFSLLRNKNLRPKSTVQTAIGIRHSQIKQISQGSMGGSFNTREYFHGKKESFVHSVKWIFIVMGFILPLLLLISNFYFNDQNILLAAVLIQYIGLLFERWYFFADANHPQNIYYQMIS